MRNCFRSRTESKCLEKYICLHCLIYIFSIETKTSGEKGEIKVNGIINMLILTVCKVMFKKRAAVFYRSIKTRGVAECFYSDKTRAASFLNGFKNIPQKACLLGFQKNVRIVRGKY